MKSGFRPSLRSTFGRLNTVISPGFYSARAKAMRKLSRCKTFISSFESMILMSASGADSISEGTDGNDFLLALNPHQTLDGLAGHDILIGLAGDNQLNGGDGHDLLFVVRQDNHVDGGEGVDTVIFWRASRAESDISRLADGRIRVLTDGNTNYLSNVEKFKFRDGEFSVDELFPATTEYRTIDGTNNNLLNPEFGSTDELLLRLSDAEYGDGISDPAGSDRPSARTVSNEVSAQHSVSPNDRGLTDMTWLWGQFVDHDVSLSTAAQPSEPFNVSVPSGDALFDPTYTGDAEIGLNRTIYAADTGVSESNPREQVTQITAWVDGSNVYGSDDVRAAALRSFDGGHLLVTDDNLLIFNNAGLGNAADGVQPGTNLFLAGDVRANENAALSAMHTLWVREHNRIVDELAAADLTLTDEDLYQKAREIVVAEIQSITYNDYLPAILGADAIDSYDGYDPGVNPAIANEFSTAAYRFGHSMLSSELLRLNNDGTVIEAGNLALRDAFFSPDEIAEHGIDSILLGAAQQAASEVDTMVVDDIRNFLFGQPGDGGFDLVSLNIQRGRDHGLADYNQVRFDIGLPRVTEFSQITSDLQLQQRLEKLYGSVDNVDLWVGGLAEDHMPGASLGETFSAIISDQFERLRDGDRFWYENIFEGETLQEIQSTTLADVIQRNTTVEGLQQNIFFMQGTQTAGTLRV